jgi:hypothetical protein
MSGIAREYMWHGELKNWNRRWTPMNADKSKVIAYQAA